MKTCSAFPFAVLLLVTTIAPLLRADEVDIPKDILRAAARVTPSPEQAAWQEMEFICFVHYTVNAFTDREWGDGKEDPAIFNPTELDPEQWARVCKEAGMKLLILTAKHHDGFCLWPSRYTEHSVKNSPWKNGKGDVVKETAEACKKYGLKFGIYLSPWDRHEQTYGTDAYNDYYKNQLRELLTNYGPITEVWMDGACGEGPNGKRQQYDFAGYFRLIEELQPHALTAIMGRDIRWVGNEDGLARESEWSVFPEPDATSNRTKDRGNRKYLVGAKSFQWRPAECDVSIRPGWFYHASQDDKVKSLSHLLDIYYRSVGRNSVLLLNLPPDRRGLIHENDVARLKEFRAVLDETFKTNLAAGAKVSANTSRNGFNPAAVTDGDGTTYWTTPEDVAEATLEIDLGKPVTFDRAMVQEMFTQGQRVEQFKLEARVEGQAAGSHQWREIAQATTIGYKRLLRFPEVTADRVRLTIEQSRDCPTIREFGLFKASPREK